MSNRQEASEHRRKRRRRENKEDDEVMDNEPEAANLFQGAYTSGDSFITSLSNESLMNLIQQQRELRQQRTLFSATSSGNLGSPTSLVESLQASTAFAARTRTSSALQHLPENTRQQHLFSSSTRSLTDLPLLSMRQFHNHFSPSAQRSTTANLLTEGAIMGPLLSHPGEDLRQFLQRSQQPLQNAATHSGAAGPSLMTLADISATRNIMARNFTSFRQTIRENAQSLPRYAQPLNAWVGQQIPATNQLSSELACLSTIGNNMLAAGNQGREPLSPGQSTAMNSSLSQPTSDNQESPAITNEGKLDTPGDGASISAVVPSHTVNLPPASIGSGTTGRSPVLLHLPCDRECLSPYHCLVRKQIELFEANAEDVQTNARGRNKPIILGQVGIRCRHCSTLRPKERKRAATYYPFKLDGLYQASQTMAAVHLRERCKHIPDDIRHHLVKLNKGKVAAQAGKRYWADSAQVLGVLETEYGLRFAPSG